MVCSCDIIVLISGSNYTVIQKYPTFVLLYVTEKVSNQKILCSPHLEKRYHSTFASCICTRQDLGRKYNILPLYPLLANMNSCYIARPSVCCRSVICLSSVMPVCPTQAVQIFRHISTALGTLAICWHPLNISRRSSQGNPSTGGFKHNRSSQV